MKTIAILGADGYIGSSLVKKLSQKYKLKVLVYNPKNVVTFKKLRNVKVFKGDILNFASLEKIIEKKSLVINLTGTTTVIKKEEDHFNVNVLGQNNVAKLCATKKARVIYFSTANIYKSVEKKSKESDKLEPTDLYSLSKKLGEEVYKFYSEKYNLASVVFRLGSVYGPNQKKGIVYTMAESAQEKGLIEIPTMEVVRDLIYIDDVLMAVEKVINYTKKGFHVFNITSGKRQTLHHLAEMISGFYGGDVVEKANRKAYPSVVYLNITKARKELGFKPKVTLKTGLRKTLFSYKI